MRTSIIDATIFRIMKARKVCTHNRLNVEVMKAVTMFKPEAKMIMRSIEDMIEKAYLERDPNV